MIRNLATGLENREDVPIYFEALNYPAVIAAPGNEQASNYLASVSLGAKNLILEIKDLGRTCGNRPIVLAGYSQGAEVIKKALTSGSQYGGVQYSLTTTDKARIRSVVMYGAPSYHAGEAWNAAGNGPSNGIFGFGRNAFESYRAMAWLPPSYSTQGWQPVIRSYCLSGDYFCQSNLTQNGKNIHASYPLTPVMNASSVFITDWLVDNMR